MIVNNFLETWQILMAVIPQEIVVIILAGVVFYIIETLKNKDNGKN